MEVGVGVQREHAGSLLVRWIVKSLHDLNYPIKPQTLGTGTIDSSKKKQPCSPACACWSPKIITRIVIKKILGYIGVIFSFALAFDHPHLTVKSKWSLWRTATSSTNPAAPGTEVRGAQAKRTALGVDEVVRKYSLCWGPNTCALTPRDLDTGGFRD